MSGLAVIFHRDGRPVAAEAVDAMLAAVPHRGPDGRWLRVWGAIGLGHAKLAVTPEEENEQQPLVSLRSDCAIAADARLDNREQLIAQLPDQPPATASDAELILRAYETWGVDAPCHLLGDFAFVVWDPRRRRVVCARDTSGQRTFFFRVDSRKFAAASEIVQLFQDPTVPVAANEARIVDYLAPFNVYRNDQEQAATFFEGIQTLEAGHVLVVDAHGMQDRRYWDIGKPREIRYRKERDYEAHFANLLGEAIRVRLRTSRPVAALLSGGLDSSSIVCLAQHLYQMELAPKNGFTTFSLQVDGMECDESYLIRDMQMQYGFDARQVPVVGAMSNFEPEPHRFMSGPRRPVCEVDLLLEAASRTGARAVLSGHYGDNCFANSRVFFASLLRRRRLITLWRHLQAHRRVTGDSFSKVAALHLALPLLPSGLQKTLYSARVRRAFIRERPNLVPGWVAGAFRERLLDRHIGLALAAEAARRFAEDSRETAFTALYPAEILPIAGDQPVQLVQPYADRRLHEFMLGIPPEQVFEPHPYTGEFYAGHKLVMRRAMMGIVPERVRTQAHKTTFGELILTEARGRWSKYEATFGPGGRPEIVERGLVDRAGFYERLHRWRDGDFGNDGIYVMRLLHVESWLRSHARARDGHGTTAVARSAGEDPSNALLAPMSVSAFEVESRSGRR